jgi:uncharacterized protein (DUF488 family)
VARIWSVGYSGHTPETFLELLRRNGIQVVADVRDRPLSRKKGFGKGALEPFLLANGVGYVHLKALGAPAPVRDAYKETGDVEAFRAAYARHLAGQGLAIGELEALARQEPTAMLCLEADASVCHRHVLARQLTADGFEVVDVTGAAANQ